MVYDKVRDIISSMLQIDPEDIKVETSFSKDLGADSLELYQTVMLVEDS